MAVYSRGGTSSNLPATQQTTQLASKDLGTIIVKSMETIAESLSGDDVPVHYKDIEKAVTVGVNKSDLVKKGLKGGQLTAGGKADAALAAKYEQEKFIKWQEYQRKLQQWDEADRRKRQAEQDKEWKETQSKIQAGFNTVVTSLDNPLKSLSNAIDKTVKDFSSGFAQGFKDARSGENFGVKENAAIAKVSSSPEITSINTQLTDLTDLIRDNFEEVTTNQTTSNDSLDDLIKDDKDDKQAQDAEKTEKEKKEKNDKEQLNATQKIGYTVGTVVGKVAEAVLLVAGAIVIGSQILMFLKGQLYKFLEQMPAKRDITIAKVKAAIESIPKRLQLVGERIMSQIHFPGFSFGGLSSEEKDEYKALGKDKDLKNYRTAMEKARQKGDKELFSLADSESLKKKDYDLSTEEGVELYRQDYLNAIRKKYKGESESDINSRLSAANSAFDAALGRKEKYESEAQASLTSPELVAKANRYEELRARSKKGPMSDDEYNRRLDAIETGYSKSVEENIAKSLGKDSSKYTQTYRNTLEESGISAANVEQIYADKEGKQLNTAPLTERETWLNEKYEPWVNAWKNLARDTKLDMNIQLEQPRKKNALNSMGN